MASFKCVFIPCDANDPMEERSFPKIKGLEDDSFMDALKKHFVNQGVLDEAIFRDGVADQLKAKGLGEPDDASKMDSIIAPVIELHQNRDSCIPCLTKS